MQLFEYYMISENTQFGWFLYKRHKIISKRNYEEWWKIAISNAHAQIDMCNLWSSDVHSRFDAGAVAVSAAPRAIRSSSSSPLAHAHGANLLSFCSCARLDLRSHYKKNTNTNYTAHCGCGICLPEIFSWLFLLFISIFVYTEGSSDPAKTTTTERIINEIPVSAVHERIYDRVLMV